MRALVVGDPHLRLARLEDNAEFLDKLLEISRRYEALVILGDLFDTFSVIRSEILSQWAQFARALPTCRTQTVFLVGNHDYSGHRGGSHALEVFSGHAMIVDRPMEILGGIRALPFMRQAEEFEKEVRAIPKGDLLLCHQSFVGARFSSGYGDTDGVSPSCVEHLSGVISGHIHVNQKIKNIWYPGTPYTMGFAESGEKKRVYGVDLSPGGYQIIEEHDLSLPSFHDLRADQIADLRVPTADERNPRDSYRLVSTGSAAEIADFWSRSDVKEFRKSVRRVVDAIVPDRGSETVSGKAKGGQSERLEEYVRSRKWRTSADRVNAAARTFLGL